MFAKHVSAVTLQMQEKDKRPQPGQAMHSMYGLAWTRSMTGLADWRVGGDATRGRPAGPQAGSRAVNRTGH